MRILITGASGSGTSTLGRALAQEIAATFIDADDHFWIASDPPYQSKRAPSERLESLLNAVQRGPYSVVAGSVVGWGSEIEDHFSLITFLSVPTEVRLARLQRRELERFGKCDTSFLEWAVQYEEGRLAGRSRVRQERWLSSRACLTLRIDGDISVPGGVKRIVQALSNCALERT